VEELQDRLIFKQLFEIGANVLPDFNFALIPHEADDSLVVANLYETESVSV
jgi:hypothetical protein